MTDVDYLDAAGAAAYRRRLEDRRHRELAEARRAVDDARLTLERRERQLAAVEAYWKERIG